MGRPTATTWGMQTPLSKEGGFAFGLSLGYDAPMPQEKTAIPHGLIAALVGAAVLIGLGAYLYTRGAAPAPVNDVTNASSTTSSGDGVEIVGSGDVTVASVPAVKAPEYRTPLSFSASVPAEVRIALSKQFDDAVETLTQDPRSYEGWVTIGILRKYVNDYKGAESAWGYAAKLYPKSTVPFSNLGSLYLDFLKDYPKAEANYKQALANDSHDINAYQQLVSLYTIYGYLSVQAGKDRALTLLEQGLSANPDNQTLLQLQAEVRSR